MNDALSFEHVEKSFRYFPSLLQRLREAFSPFGKTHHVAVPVLHDVTFSVPRGQVVAIIGPNGVGKSTMLHMVAGLVEPSSGSVRVHGRVTSLLDLGGSFLPDLTGRENARFFHQIVARGVGDADTRERAIERFADIGEFFDRPLRTYSTGMALRLAFATATWEDPDILLIDEVLAVGDARFQQKCYRRLRELRERGTTILLVTHVVQGLAGLCDRVLVIENGRIVFDGDPGRGVDRYYQLFFMAPEQPARGDSSEFRYGNGGAAIAAVFASRDGINEERAFGAGDVMRLVIDLEFSRAVQAPQMGLACSNKEGVRIYATSSGLLGETLRAAQAGERRRMEIECRLDMAVSDLFLDLSIFEVSEGAMNVLDNRVGVLHLTVAPPRHFAGITDLSAVIREVR
ncbi:MAG TPA: ATP-binding cassette domain-containing protein [Thermoanaerobaculia bacterium]|jgi:ABC-type polysaccharide/polyol phosphate transport system ATPase subunit|nr:ATP-binding cassette domain-containing protein [Thermoanaerobaculia bacterium]